MPTPDSVAIVSELSSLCAEAQQSAASLYFGRPPIDKAAATRIYRSVKKRMYTMFITPFERDSILILVSQLYDLTLALNFANFERYKRGGPLLGNAHRISGKILSSITQISGCISCFGSIKRNSGVEMAKINDLEDAVLSLIEDSACLYSGMDPVNRAIIDSITALRRCVFTLDYFAVING